MRVDSNREKDTEDLLTFVYGKHLERERIRVTSLLKEIVNQETNALHERSRIHCDHYTYPLEILFFEDPKVLGQYCDEHCEIRINRVLLGLPSERLKNVLRHELAHFFTFRRFFPLVEAHGPEFRSICKEFNWGREVYLAKETLSLNDIKEHNSSDGESFLEKERIFRKIEKLFNLALSPNEYEAKLAMEKAQELIDSFFLHSFSLGDAPSFRESERDVIMRRIFWAPRRNVLGDALALVLREFNVRPVHNRSSSLYFLEITGEKFQVEMAHYVADFLQGEFQRRWEGARHKLRLSGIRAKNSYILGLAKGLANKKKSSTSEYLKKNFDKNTELSLVKISQSFLDDALNLVYPNLSKTSSGRRTDASAYHAGQEDGKNINLHIPIENQRNSSSFQSETKFLD